MSRTRDDGRRSSVPRRRHGRGLACVRMLLAIALAAVSTDTRRAQACEPAPPPPPHDAVGVAARGPDGSIVMTLRADGAAGDAQVRYAPADPDHAMIARHVGPIPPGGSVPVRPFPARRPALDSMGRPVPEVR